MPKKIFKFHLNCFLTAFEIFEIFIATWVPKLSISQLNGKLLG